MAGGTSHIGRPGTATATAGGRSCISESTAAERIGPSAAATRIGGDPPWEEETDECETLEELRPTWRRRPCRRVECAVVISSRPIDHGRRDCAGARSPAGLAAGL